METLSKIPSEGNWQDIAVKVNENFTKVGNEIGKLGMTTMMRMPLITSKEAALQKIPKPYDGQLILIGTTVPAPVFRWDKAANDWLPTGGNGGDASIPLDNYYTKEEIDKKVAENVVNIELDDTTGEVSVTYAAEASAFTSGGINENGDVELNFEY